MNLYGEKLDELLARSGTFDITGTAAVSNKNFFAFTPSDGAVLEAIKGIPLKSAASTTTEITSAEVDLATYFLTTLTDPLVNELYRVPGYIITHIKLTSGTIHGYLAEDQPT